MTPKETQAAELTRLRSENEQLRRVTVDLHWMARRYADGRQSYAPSLFNDHVRTLLALGVPLNATGDQTIWAADGNPRCMDVTPEDMGPEWAHYQNVIDSVMAGAERLRLRAEAGEKQVRAIRDYTVELRAREQALPLGNYQAGPFQEVLRTLDQLLHPEPAPTVERPS